MSDAGAEPGGGEETDSSASRDGAGRLSGALSAIGRRLRGSSEDDLREQLDANGDGELALYSAEHRETVDMEHPVRTQVLEDVKETFEHDLESTYFDERPTESQIERQYFDFSYLEEYEELERYWVDRPFAYVTILHHPEKDEITYRVVEPVLDEFETYVRDEFTKILRNSLMYQEIDSEEHKATMFSRRARELIEEHTAAIQTISIHKLLYYLVRDFIELGKIEPIMADEAIEDISCDGVDVPVFVYHRRYRDLDTNVRFGEQELQSFVVRLAQRSGKHLSLSNPLVDASLPEGSRIQLTLGGDVATRGPNFTIRQFSSVPDTPIDLI
ncbi:MAG: pilus assembly protein, partial [Halobacteriaceae archaeon]